MSLSTLGYTPSVADARVKASKIALAKQIADYDGSDLATPDTPVQMPFLADFTLPISSSEESDKYWDGRKYVMDVTEDAKATMVVVSGRQAVITKMGRLMDSNIYLFFVERTSRALNGKYQLQVFMGELVGKPDAGAKDPKKTFEFNAGAATADVVIDLEAIQTAGDFDMLSITLPVGASVTIPKGEFTEIYETDWS